MENNLQNDENGLTAKDFCFYLEVDPTDGDTYAFFCPIKFFKENGQMSKELYDALDEVVPADMDEVADNCYSSSKSLDEVEQKLLDLGFVKDDEFWKFMDSIGVPSEDDDSSTPALTGS